MQKLIDNLRQAIGNGDLESALETLQNYAACKNLQLYNEVILQRSSLSQNNLNTRQGIITNDDALRVRTKINLAVLSLLAEFEKKTIEQEESKELSTFTSRQITCQPAADSKSGILKDNESRELALIGDVFKITAEAGHIFRPTPNSDWGIDGEIEFKDNEGKATGRRVYLQLKSGDSYLYRRKKDNKEIFTVKSPRHCHYWLGQPCPVLLLIRSATGQIRWMNITEYLQFYGANINQIEFNGESFTADIMEEIKKIAEPCSYIEKSDSSKKYC